LSAYFVDGIKKCLTCMVFGLIVDKYFM